MGDELAGCFVAGSGGGGGWLGVVAATKVVSKVVDPSWPRQKNKGLNRIGAMKKQMAISTTAGLLAISLTTYAQTSVFATGARRSYPLP